MIGRFKTRDYGLTGPSSRLAEERGLVNADWYRPDLPREVIKDLTARRDGPAIRDTAIWLAALLAAGGAAWASWGTWWTVPCLIVYGLLYGSVNDARWHEAGHGTAFRTRWMNDALYQLSSFATLREPEIWRWSHARHHTDTIIVGRDPEIVAMRPPEMVRFLLSFLGIPHAIASARGVARHVFGIRGEAERTFIPEHAWPSIFRTARIWVVIHLAVIGTAVWTGSILPVLLVGPLPTMYGAWLAYTLGVTQHVGLAEDVLDHRLNARTIRMNPVLRFIYWNMNYHLEHHLYPMVPYHRLPDLHGIIKDDLPPIYPSTFAAWREIIGAIRIQLREDPEFYVERQLPETGVGAPSAGAVRERTPAVSGTVS